MSLQYSFFEPEWPDILAHHQALSGHGLPREEMCEVLLAMKSLGGDVDQKVFALRFFGKVWTLTGCYYIFECQMTERPEQVCMRYFFCSPPILACTMMARPFAFA
jgi:Radial spokehead-like protein